MASNNPKIAPATRAQDVIGGSEVAAIVGVHPYMTAFDLAATKKGLAERAPSNVLRRGKILERPVAELWAVERGKTIEWLDTTVQHPDHPWAVVTPDFRVDSPEEGGEVKTVRYEKRDQWGEEGSDECPPNVLIQAQWACLIKGWARINVVAFMGDMDHVPGYVVESDPEFQGILLEKARDFRDKYLLTDSLPPITAPSEILDSYIKKRYPGAELKPARLANDAEAEGIKALIEVRQRFDELEEGKKLMEDLLKTQIADCEGLYGEGFRLSWKPVKAREKTDWEGIARTLGATPDLIAKFTARGESYRRFLLSIKGEK